MEFSLVVEGKESGGWELELGEEPGGDVGASG